MNGAPPYFAGFISNHLPAFDPVQRSRPIRGGLRALAHAFHHGDFNAVRRLALSSVQGASSP